MRLLADLHISPRTVLSLRSLGHDVVRVNEVMPVDSPDEAIVAQARRDRRVVLTQDLGFSAIIALSGAAFPSVISLRLASSDIDRVNAVPERVLPGMEQDVARGTIITVEDHRIRRRPLPID